MLRRYRYRPLRHPVVIVAVLVALIVGIAAGRAWAAVDSGTARPAVNVTGGGRTGGPGTDLTHASGPFVDLDQAIADYEQLLADQQAARDAAAAVLVPLGWAPGACEPLTPLAPPLGALPACPGISPSVDHWLVKNRCEQGGDWHAYGPFKNGLVGGGGLGISDGAWVSWGGLAYAPNASLASPWAQMVVASTGWEQQGDGPWGCKN